MKNASYKTNDVKRVCENKLDIQFRSGKEFNGWYILDGVKTCRITVPKGKKDLKPGTYRSMAKQLKLSIDEFDLLLDCPLKKSEYETILSNQQ